MRALWVIAIGLMMLLAACNRPAGDTGTASGAGEAKAPTAKPTVEIGTARKPVVMAFVPSTEMEKIVEGAKPLMKLLEEKTGLKFKDYVATSYIGVVEAMGQGHVHVAWLPTLAYVLAHQRNGAEVVLKVVRGGKDTYYGLIFTRTDSGINTLEDLKGRTFAFVEEASASGHLYPRALLLQHGIDPDKDLARYMFAGGHDSAVLAVYKGNVDAGAMYDDARDKFKDTMPEIFQETKVIGKTDPIPSDTVAVARDLPPEIVAKIVQALMEIVSDEQTKHVLYDLYDIEGLVPAKDSDYDSVREMANVLDLDLEKEVGKG